MTIVKKIVIAARHKHAEWIMAVASFAESSVFPIPPDVMLAPMVVARPERYLRYALVCTIASVLGGILGYAIGAYLYDVIGAKVIAFYGYEDVYASLGERYAKWGVWLVIIAGFTPLPYKVFTIASGVFGFNLPLFILGSVVSRGARYLLVCWIVKHLGPRSLELIERRGNLFALIFCIVVVAGFAALKFL